MISHVISLEMEVLSPSIFLLSSFPLGIVFRSVGRYQTMCWQLDHQRLNPSPSPFHSFQCLKGSIPLTKLSSMLTISRNEAGLVKSKPSLLPLLVKPFLNSLTRPLCPVSKWSVSFLYLHIDEVIFDRTSLPFPLSPFLPFSLWVSLDYSRSHALPIPISIN